MRVVPEPAFGVEHVLTHVRGVCRLQVVADRGIPGWEQVEVSPPRPPPTLASDWPPLGASPAFAGGQIHPQPEVNYFAHFSLQLISLER